MATPPTTERLWQLLGRRLRETLQRSISDPQAAEDLLQEVFLRIHEGLPRLREQERLEPGSFASRATLVVDYRRSRGADCLDAEEAVEVLADEPESSDNWNEVVGGWLPEMIERLPEPYRAAVRLFELEGVPQHEIAQRIGLSLSGAKSRIQRGREKLKALLFECCSFELDPRKNVVSFERRANGECTPCQEDPEGGASC